MNPQAIFPLFFNDIGFPLGLSGGYFLKIEKEIKERAG
jgi:hypothetical protein